MYINPTAQIRPELSAVVEEAAFADKYFIGLKVFPVYNSERDTGEYYKITKSATELLKKNITDRAPGSPYGKVTRTFEKDSYACRDRGIEEDLDDTVTARMSNFFGTEELTSKLLLRSIMMDHEIRVAAELFNPVNFPVVNSLIAYTEPLLATINFGLDLSNAMKGVAKLGEQVNTMVLNRDVWDRIRRSTLLASYFFGPLGGGKDITLQMVAAAFGLDQILIADAVIDTSKKGQTALPTYIWSSNYIWIGNIQGGDFRAGGAGRTIVWTGDTSSVFVTESYRKEDIRSDCIRVRCHTAEKVISSSSGVLIATQFA